MTRSGRNRRRSSRHCHWSLDAAVAPHVAVPHAHSAGQRIFADDAAADALPAQPDDLRGASRGHLAHAERLPSRFDDGVRGLRREPEPERLRLLRNSADLYLNEPLSGPTLEEWWGWRPMTPDGLPFIGRSPAFDNVYLAAGHGMLGVSMAPATGKLVAELLSESTVAHRSGALRRVAESLTSTRAARPRQGVAVTRTRTRPKSLENRYGARSPSVRWQYAPGKSAAARGAALSAMSG